MYAVVYLYSWYKEPYGFYVNKEDAEQALFLAKRARPNHVVELVRIYG
jgi:hypothetical protein